LAKPKIKLFADTAKFLEETPDGIRIYQVDGAVVRSSMDVDFALGGHWLVKGYIPINELWVEKMPNQEDECAILAHEIKECRLMRDRKLSYKEAHKEASGLEQMIRHEPSACTVVDQMKKEKG
jgi:hypothetical protein